VTPERLMAVEQLFHEVRELPAVEREAWLDAACAGDPSLRREVESLLAQSGGILDAAGAPAVAPSAMPRLSPGASIAQYRIEALLGAGGMGEVYRARDTALGRDVALKVLPRDFTADPQRLSRFEREARLLAALNHPNIGGIYGIVEHDGVRGLVLEFIDGPTLADRLRRGPLAIEEALGVAFQIAQALEAAHERGVMHRDLKPANIKIGPRGVVKVIDFGLGKADRAVGEAAQTVPPTVASETRPGLILGTAAYMSPEQARGQPVDKRTDVWAFGCVLFEMLTGRGAFAADTGSDSLARVIEREPDWHRLPPAVPEPIRRLVQRCLQKDPENRLHDIGDARIELGEAPLSTDVGERRPSRPGARVRYIAAGVAAAALALVAAALWNRAIEWPRGPVAGRAMEFGVTFPNNYIPADGVAISPDGRRIAANVWSGTFGIWVQSLDVDGSAPRPLPGAERAGNPFWSPDSTTVAFFQGGQIVTMNADGGPRTIVARLKQRGGSGTWSRENVILFAAGGKLFRVPASGGEPIAVPVAGVSGRLLGPVFLPDGRHFVFCADERSGGSLHLASLDDGRARTLGPTICPGGFAPPDRVLFVRGSSIVTLGPWPELTLSASDTGTLVFPASRGGSSLGRLTWFDRDEKVVGTIEPPGADVEYLNPAICPANGDLVAANRFDPETGAWHIWLIDGTRGNAASRLTSDSAPDVDPAWTADGKAIVYMSARSGRRAFYRQAVAGGAPVEVLDVEAFEEPMPGDVANNGRLLFSDLQRSIWTFVPGDSRPAQLGRPVAAYGPRLSPDGKWLAYAVSQGGAFDVYVERFPGGSPRSKVSLDGGTHPRWTAGGKEIVYWTPPGGIVSTDLVLTDQQIRVGATRTLLHTPALTLIDARTAYDITRDGRRILMRQPAGPPSPGIRVIVNWTAKLK